MLRQHISSLKSATLFLVLAQIPCVWGIDTQIDHATISLSSPTQNMDPTQSVTATDRAIYALTNGTLMNVNPAGEVEPGLAESITYSDDFTSATVKIRPGLKFSDGSPLTAEDVAATFIRHMGVEGSILNTFMSRLDRVEAVDELTAVFHFTAPFASFGNYTSTGSYGIYPARLINNPDFFAGPAVTSGPYRITSNWRGNRMELVQNDYYYETPAIRSISFRIVNDANSAISQLQAGQLDYIGDLPPNFVIPLRRMRDVAVSVVPAYGFQDLRIWNRDGPFADVNMRRAVSAALDRDAIVRIIWGEANQAMAGFWPPIMEGYDPEIPTTANLEAARDYLQRTECANGCEIRMIYSDQEFPFSGQLALIVQNQLANVGIRVRLERLDAATLISRLFAGNFDMVPGAMAASANIPDHLLGNALDGRGFLRAEFSGYNSDEMNAVIDVVSATAGEERAAALARIEDIFAKDQPYFIFAPLVRVAASRLPPEVISLVGNQIAVGSID